MLGSIWDNPSVSTYSALVLTYFCLFEHLHSQILSYLEDNLLISQVEKNKKLKGILKTIKNFIYLCIVYIIILVIENC